MNRAKIKGGCQIYTKAAHQDSKSDLPLVGTLELLAMRLALGLEEESEYYSILGWPTCSLIWLLGHYKIWNQPCQGKRFHDEEYLMTHANTQNSHAFLYSWINSRIYVWCFILVFINSFHPLMSIYANYWICCISLVIIWNTVWPTKRLDVTV